MLKSQVRVRAGFVYFMYIVHTVSDDLGFSRPLIQTKKSDMSKMSKLNRSPLNIVDYVYAFELHTLVCTYSVVPRLWRILVVYESFVTVV